MRLTIIAAMGTLVVALSACGSEVFNRTLIGGAAGATAGKLGWEAPVEGALIGGAIGAATAVTPAPQ